MGGSSVGRVIKFLGGVKQNWAGQCEVVGGGRAIVICNDQQSLLIPAVGRCKPRSRPRAEPGGGPGDKAPGSSWDFAFSSSWPKISEDPAVYSATKEAKIAFPMQCVISFYFITAWSKKDLSLGS